jgi:hypothetical protein
VGAIPLDVDVTKLSTQQLEQLEEILSAATEPVVIEAAAE